MESVLIFATNWLPFIFIFLFVLWGITRSGDLDRRKLLLYPLGIALVARFVFASLLKGFFAIARPDGGLIVGDGYSFPSGHATFFFALAAAVYMKDKRWGAVFLILAAVLSILRVATGLHYTSDILAGAALGVLVAFVGSWLIKWRSSNISHNAG